MDQELETHSDAAKPSFGKFRRRFVSVLVLAVSLGLTFGFYLNERNRAESKSAFDLQHLTNTVRDDLRIRLRDYRHLMLSGLALIHSSENVTREEWRELVKTIELSERFPEVLGLSLIEIVPDDLLEDWVQAQRDSGAPDFAIKTPETEVENPLASDHFIIKYHEPAERNRSAWGIDIASQGINRLPSNTAEKGNALRMTTGVTFVQTKDTPGSGVVLTMPVGFDNASLDEARPGWITIPFELSRCLASIWRPEWESYRIQIADPEGTSMQVLFDTHGGQDLGAEFERLSAEASLSFAGRNLDIRVFPGLLVASEHDFTHARNILIVGTILSGMLSLLVWSISRTRDRAEAIVLEQTKSMRESEARLRHLAVDAQSANRTKSEFLANMSHEIRTPMTAILGYTEILGQPETSESNRAEALDTIRRNGEHLLEIINDVLSISKIESGQLQIHLENFSPQELVRDIFALLNQKAEAKGLELGLEVDRDFPAVIRSDPLRLRQILLNLIGNAVKFTPQGSIRVLLINDAVSGQIVFEVLDTGIGVEREMVNELFDPFIQGDTTHTRDFGGTGLGLAISRQLAEALGGTLGVDPSYRSGSRFVLTLENTRVDEAEQAADQESKSDPGAGGWFSSPARILLAEDCPDNQRLLVHHLKHSGHHVTTADDGIQAVDLATRASLAGTPFDLIFMDMQMPHLDGFGAVSRLRAMGYDGYIVALTAHAMEHDKQRCLDAGCDAFATKPITRDRLLELVRQAPRRPEAA